MRRSWLAGRVETSLDNKGYGARVFSPDSTVITELLRSFRLWLRTPGVALVAVVTTALGITLTTALVSISDAALLRPLPFPSASELVRLIVETKNGTQLNPRRQDVDVLERLPTSVIAHRAVWRTVQVTTEDGLLLRTRTAREVADGYFETYRLSPVVGRFFAPDEYLALTHDVVMVSESLWRREYGGDVSLVGQNIRCEGRAQLVVGIAPTALAGSADVVLPMSRSLPATTRVSTAVRLAAYTSLGTATSALTAAQSGDSLAGVDNRLVFLSAYDMVTQDNKRTVWMLLGAASLILLTCCVNLVGLFLSRVPHRQAEFATRSALGAARSDILRHSLVEHVAITVVGGLLGLILVPILVPGLTSVLPLSLLPGRSVTLNLGVLSVSAVLIVVVTIIASVVPAARTARMTLGRNMRTSDSGIGRRTRQVVISVQSAVASILVIVAIAMAFSLSRLARVDIGFDPSGFAVVDIRPGSDEAYPEFYANLTSRLRSSPGIVAAGAVDHLPLGGSYTRLDSGSVLAGTSKVRFAPQDGWDVRHFLPGYFETVGLKLQAGSLPATVGAVVLVNIKAARLLFGDDWKRAVGQDLTVSGERRQLIGIVDDVRHSGPSALSVPELYLPATADQRLSVVLRGDKGLQGLDAIVRRVVTSMGVSARISPARHGTEFVEAYLSKPRNLVWISAMLAASALLLALVGTIAMASHDVQLRAHDSAIRAALGASKNRLVAENVLRSTKPFVFGLAVGLAAARLMEPVIDRYLFATSSGDSTISVATAAALSLVGILAAWVPSKRVATFPIRLRS